MVTLSLKGVNSQPNVLRGQLINQFEVLEKKKTFYIKVRHTGLSVMPLLTHVFVLNTIETGAISTEGERQED